MTATTRQNAHIPAIRSIIFASVLACAAIVLATGCGSKATAELCPVSGEALGSMGDPFVVEHEGKQIKLCCEGCKDDFDKDPAKYVSKVAN